MHQGTHRVEIALRVVERALAQNATTAGVVSSTANTTQTTTPIDRPVVRRSAVAGSMVWVAPEWDIRGLLGPTSWAHTVPTCGFALCRPPNRRMEIILLWSGIVD
jgi:hypothetical protein